MLAALLRKTGYDYWNLKTSGVQCLGGSSASDDRECYEPDGESEGGDGAGVLEGDRDEDPLDQGENGETYERSLNKMVQFVFIADEAPFVMDRVVDARVIGGGRGQEIMVH